MFGGHAAQLVQPDTMFAADGAAQPQRATRNAFTQRFGAGPFGSIGRVEQHQHMEIAIADMADHRRDQPGRIGFGAGFQNRFGQAGYRHTGIG